MSEVHTELNLKRIRKLLKQTARIARDASLTGALAEGGKASALQYNRTLEILERAGEVPAGLFPPLEETARFDEIGVAASQVAAYLEDDEGESPQRERTVGSNNVSINVGGVKGLDELKELGQVIREHLPEWLAGMRPTPEENGAAGSLSEVESRLAEVGAKLQAVAEQLRRGDLSDGQQAELAEQLSRLGQEQATLARRHAALRDERREEAV